MTYNAVQPCLQRGRLSSLPHLPPPSHTLAVSKPPNYTQVGLVHTHSPRVNADTWQIKGLINSLCWTIPPTTKDQKNKQIPVGLARPSHLVGLSVGDWVAQSCSVWGLGWSHNCFLWAAQPPEPLHNYLSGWYCPPLSFLHVPQTATPSSSLPEKRRALTLNPPLSLQHSEHWLSFFLLSSQPVHSHGCSPC